MPAYPDWNKEINKKQTWVQSGHSALSIREGGEC